jgi:DNA gyrase subunit A
MITNARNGKVVASLPVVNDADIILVSSQGQIMRCPVDDIRTTGRRTQGVIVFRLPKEEEISSLCVGVNEEDEA